MICTTKISWLKGKKNDYFSHDFAFVVPHLINLVKFYSDLRHWLLSFSLSAFELFNHITCSCL